jgi:YrbI family 3-deoxy-D-manno-octulosonate 8-phosphate phosphatase
VCRQGVPHDGKLAVYRELCRRFGVEPEETAAMGDDEPDVEMMRAAGFSACPFDARPEAKRAASVVLRSRGGRGAVRELVELLIARNQSLVRSP